MTRRFAWASLAALCVAGAATAQLVVIDAKPLPLATQRIAASSDECAVWRREQAFARSVEAHDARRERRVGVRVRRPRGARVIGVGYALCLTTLRN